MKRSICTLMVWLAGHGLAAAQPAAPVRLTLDEAVTRGLQSSHRVEESLIRVQGADATVQARDADRGPQVTASAGYTRTNHVREFGFPLSTNQLLIIYPDIPDNYRSRLEGQWTLYNGGRFDALKSAAEREAAAAGRDVEALKSDLTLEITRAFWNLVVARESYRVVTDALTRIGAHVRDVRNRLDAGLVPPNEVLTAEAQESHQRMLSIQAATSRDVVEAELARLVGLPPGQLIEPLATLTAPAVDTEIDALVAEARSRRADRQALVERTAAAGARIDAAEAGRRPTIGVLAGGDYARPNAKIFPRVNDWQVTWDASVNVSWALFDSGRVKANVTEATLARQALEARTREFDSLVSLEVRQRVSELEATRASLDAADSGLRSATEALRVVTERYAAGVATNTDVLDAQNDVLQAELERTRTLAFARINEARLSRALGR